MPRALTLIPQTRIETETIASPTTAQEDVFQAFHADLEARAKIATFPDGLKRRGR